MKLSIEAKVVAVVAIAFAALSMALSRKSRANMEPADLVGMPRQAAS